MISLPSKRSDFDYWPRVKLLLLSLAALSTLVFFDPLALPHLTYAQPW